MKLTKKLLTKIVEEVLNEQPPQQPAASPTDKEGDAEKPKPLKIDIPDSPFEPDVNQVKDRLKQILKIWKTKEYPSDEIRWKSYHNDIVKLLKKLDGDD